MHPISKPHDKFVKGMLSHRDVAQDFLCAHLPIDLIKQVNLASLSIVENEHVSALRILKTDVVYMASMLHTKQKIFFLIEHFRQASRFVPLRLLEYSCELMRHCVDELQEKCLPIVVPIILYNGKQRYEKPKSLFDLFGEHKNLASSYLMQPFTLVDVKHIPDATLLAQGKLGVMEYMLKHIDRKNILQDLQKIALKLKKLAKFRYGKGYSKRGAVCAACFTNRLF